MWNALRSPFQRSGLRRTRTGGSFVWALKDVSFEVVPGDVLGVIGRNGAGKTTLLKVLSRITAPTEGRAHLNGRVGSLLEVGTGFHPELSGRHNVYLNGAILGMTRKEINRKFDEIVAFAEVEKFIDTPVKRYSSGMYVRLAFAVAAHLEPEILIVDEVLAVGDFNFQKKCLGKMQDVSREGRTVLFFSHNMAAVQNLCTRGIVLDAGRLVFDGTEAEAVERYLRNVRDVGALMNEAQSRAGTGDIRITGIELRDLAGQPIDTVMCGQSFDVFLHFAKRPGYSTMRAIASLVVKTQFDVPVSLNHNRLTRDVLGPLSDRGAFVCRIERLPLAAASYRLECDVYAQGELLDAIPDAAELTVVEGDFYGSGEVPPSSHGVCLLDTRWRLESPTSRPRSTDPTAAPADG